MRYMLSYALPGEAAKAFRKEHQTDEIVDEVALNNFAARIKEYVLWDAEKSVSGHCALLNGTGHCVETGTSQMLYLTTLLIGGDDETIAGRRISLELRGRGLDRIDAIVTDKAHAAEYRFSKYEVVTVD